MESSTESKDLGLLASSDLSGLTSNKVVDYCIEMLLFASRVSKVNNLDISIIESLKEKMVNDILIWSSKLSATKEYDEKDIIKLRYCLCVFIDEMLMKNELFMNSSWANNTLTVRLFDEILGGDNFYDIALSWLHKDFLEFVYACLVLGYKGKYTNSHNVEERILYFCNNISSALTPLYEVNSELAFNKAYDVAIKTSAWQNFQKIYLKKILVALPICIVLIVFAYNAFDLESYNTQIQNKVSKVIHQSSLSNK